MKKSFLCFSFASLFVLLARAELPESVIQACLSPSLTEHISGQTWQLMDLTTWDTTSMRITETPDATITAKAATAHPQSWATTEMSITQPNDTDARLATEQTLTIKVTAKNVVPSLSVSFYFLNNATLPPCKVITKNGKLTIVSNQNDWYIIADDPAMTITQTEEAMPKTTLSLSTIKLEKFTSASASIRVGEGPLP
jgi:hypothetical protein